MSKIGIVTFSNATDNYGQVLQYLATQEFLQKQGHQASLLILSGHRQNEFQKVFSFIRRCIAWGFRRIRRVFPRHLPVTDTEKRAKEALFSKWAAISAARETAHTRRFAEFKNKYFRTFYGTYEDVADMGFSVCCAGSDQIWAWADSLTLLSWAPAGCAKISIASSVGHWDFTQENLSWRSKMLKDFRFITVREDNGLDFCHCCGRDDAVKVLDPTFLLSAEDYERYSSREDSKRPYVLVYLLGGEIEKPVAEIVEFVKKHGYDIRYVESQGRNEPIASINATVEDWLGLVRGADYVLTNSFHGMAFSIIFRRPFLVFPLIGVMASMNGRIEDLAKQTGLQDRIYSGSLAKLFDAIDWSEADQRIKENYSQLSSMVKAL